MESQSYYGYIRVSSRDQREKRQLITMHEAGVPDKNISLVTGKNGSGKTIVLIVAVIKNQFVKNLLKSKRKSNIMPLVKN